MVDLGYIIVSKLSIFRSDVQGGLRRDPVNQTYTTYTEFQTAFTEAHQELREIEVSVDESGFQSTNVIVSQSVQELRSERP